MIADDEPAPVSVEAAFNRLRSIRTLRTVIVAFAAMGFGLFTAPVLSNMFLEQQYDLDTVGRGLVATIGGLAGLLVIPFVGRYYDLRFRTDPAQALRLIGLLTLPSALLTPVQYFMPNAVLYTIASIPQVVLLSSAFTMIGPLLQTIVPYRLRGLGAAMGSIYVFFFGATGGALIALPLTNAYGPRTTILLMLIPATVIGGLMIIRSASFIHGDLAMAVDEIREEDDDHRRRAADPDNVPVVHLNGVDFAYGNVQVLFDVTLEVRRGEVLALLGTNGAGKSTILRADRRAQHAVTRRGALQRPHDHLRLTRAAGADGDRVARRRRGRVPVDDRRREPDHCDVRVPPRARRWRGADRACHRVVPDAGGAP